MMDSGQQRTLLTNGHGSEAESISVQRLRSNFLKVNTISKFSTAKKDLIHYSIDLPDLVIEEKTVNKKISAPSKSTHSQPPEIKWTIDDRKYEKAFNSKQLPLAPEPEATDSDVICGENGTIRGVKNKVRATLAAFQQTTTQKKTQEYMSSEKGDVVVYTTTNGIVRNTFHQCLRVKTILSTLQVPFEERNIFHQGDHLKELKQRLAISKYNFFDNESINWEDVLGKEETGEKVNGDLNGVLVPQVFVEGRHLGGGSVVENLNECGRLKEILKRYMSPTANQVCASCGNYRLLICQLCKGSKTSPRKHSFSPNNWFARKMYLKCTACDENGLVRCNDCKR
ncbi:hypothetical protein CHUAL_004099 [Chamberlinius hualienensis]